MHIDRESWWEEMNLLLDISLTIISCISLGKLLKRFRLPEFLGYILAGMILGSFLQITDLENIEPLGKIGLILLFFFIGLKEVELESIMREKVGSAVFGIFTQVIPFIAVYFLMRSYGFDNVLSLFMGIAAAESSITASLTLLLLLKKVRTRFGRILIGASMVEDIISLFLLAIVSSYAHEGKTTIFSLIVISLKVLAFFLSFIGLYIILPKITKKYLPMESMEVRFGLAMFFVFFIAYLADIVGLSSILGAFLSGIALSKISTFESEEFEESLSVVSGGFFIPLAMAWLGMHIEISKDMFSLFSLSFAVAMILSKLFASTISSFLSRITLKEGIGIGIAMAPNAELGLIALAIAREVTHVPSTLFSAVFFSMVFTIFFSSSILKFFLEKAELPE